MNSETPQHDTTTTETNVDNTHVDTEQSAPETPDMNVVALESELADNETSPNREAAKWRVKAREAEQQRDTLQAKLEAVQRDQVNAHAAVHGIKPEALWASGVELHELLDANGVPDEKAITAAVAAARTTLGIESPRKPVRSLKSGAAIPQERRDSWSSAFAPRER